VIEEHAFNTRWWGRPVGIVREPGFFDLPEERRRQELTRFAWVEYRGPLGPSAPRQELRRAGFVQVDTQVEFRLGVARIEESESLAGLDVAFADETPFRVEAGDLAPFEHERFLCLPGCTARRLQERIALWSGELLASHPQWCLRVERGGKPQGWFLSRPGTGGLNLTLAMLRRRAAISGMHLYHRALRAYADRGARVGFASFSVANTAVLNIYAALGAKFLTPTGCWIRVGDEPPAVAG